MLADLGLLYCALFWGISFVSMKILIDVYPSCWLLFIRFIAAAVMMYIFFHKRVNSSWRKTLWPGIIVGALLFAALITQTIALKFIDAGRSAFISATYVLIVPLMVWAWKKIFPGWLTIIAACICVAGMYLLTGDGLSGSFSAGDTLTFSCAVIFAVEVICLSTYTQGCDPLVLSFVQFTALALLSLAGSLLFETRTELLSSRGLTELLFTIVFCTFGCYTVQTCAQKYANPSHAVIIMSLESVFGLLGGIIFLGESLTLRAGVGCALIFASVLISELHSNIKRTGG